MRNLSILIFLPVLFFLFFASIRTAYAQRYPWSTGYYVNLFGGGADENGNIGDYNGEAACDISTGTCTARNRYSGQDYPDGNVQRYVCNGRVLNCDNTHASGNVVRGPDYGKEVSIHESDLGGVACNQTVQLDVFDRMGGELKGYMTWYSGSCPSASVQQAAVGGAPAPTATPTPIPTATPTPVPTLTPTPTPTPTLIPTPTPTPQVSVIRKFIFAQAQPTSTPTPTHTQVVTRKITQLPATGVPVEGWFFMGAIPLGLFLMSLRKRSI